YLARINTDSRMRSGGFEAGAQAGYNRELPNGFVAGIETDLQWSDIRASGASVIAGAYLYNPVDPFFNKRWSSVNQNWFGTTRLRIGSRPIDRLLVYATGGLAYSGFSAGLGRSGYNPDGASTEYISGWGSSTRLGWAAGTGFEYALSRHVSFKTEYLYTQSGSFRVGYSGFDTDFFNYSCATQVPLSTR